MKAGGLGKLLSALLVAGVVGAAFAKLPPPTEEQKAAAAAAKAKAAEAAKREAEALARAQDRVVERYKKEKGIKAAPPGGAAKKK